MESEAVRPLLRARKRARKCLDFQARLDNPHPRHRTEFRTTLLCAVRRAYTAQRLRTVEINEMRRFSLRLMFVVVTLLAVACGVVVPWLPRQPRLQIPRGTNPQLAQAFREAWVTPPPRYLAMRPGWADVEYSEPMQRIVAFKQEAVPVLIANLESGEFQLQVIQMLGDLKAAAAVPALVDQLEVLEKGPEFDDRRGDDVFDEFTQSLLLAKLADITGHPDGHRFYRSGFSSGVRQQAVAAYRQWHRDQQSSSGK